MAWKDLSIAQRSQLMNLYRRNGVESLSDMRQIYDTLSFSQQRPDPYLQYEQAPMYAGGGDKNTLQSSRYNAKQERAMYDYLRWRGLNHQQASGPLGNLAVESYLNADLQQIGGSAYGLIQAEAGRKEAMINHNDTPYLFGSTLTPEEQQQLDYIIDKGINTYTAGEWGRKGYAGARQARQAFLNTTNTQEASDIITNNYLRPGKPHLTRRRAMSEYYDEKYSNTLPYSIEKYQGNIEFGNGGTIHIKKKNRGKFNATKKRTGKTTEELTHSKNPLTRRRAIFAQNAAKWNKKKSYGGIKF